MSGRAWGSLGLVGLFVGVVAARLAVGPDGYGLRELSSPFVVLRVHAVGIASLAGAALSLAGLLMQGLFRNPLAEPGILGIGAGANLGGMLAMTFTGALASRWQSALPPELYLAVGAIFGAWAVLAVLLSVMRRRLDPVSVLLVGVVLTMFLGSVGAVFRALIADRWELSRAILAFTMGDVTGKGVRHLLLAAPLVFTGALATWLLGPELDLLASGEEEAASLGVDVARVRLWAVIWTAVLVAAAVSVGGAVPFVGLLVPQMLRHLFGYHHRDLVFRSLLLGAILLVACDGLSVAVDSANQIPLGGITGLIGAPLFFVLLLRARANNAFG
jgi:iron complex transport system permease protein